MAPIALRIPLRQRSAPGAFGTNCTGSSPAVVAYCPEGLTEAAAGEPVTSRR